MKGITPRLVAGMKNHDLKRPSRGSHQVYYNANPKKLVGSDCVIRALAVAFDKTWYQMFDELTDFARQKAMTPTDDICWKAYVEEQNVQHIQTIRRGKHLWKDGDAFVKAHKDGRYILQMAKHVSVSVDGVIYDIWDCSDRFVYQAWKVLSCCVQR